MKYANIGLTGETTGLAKYLRSKSCNECILKAFAHRAFLTTLSLHKQFIAGEYRPKPIKNNFKFSDFS